MIILKEYNKNLYTKFRDFNIGIAYVLQIISL